MTRVAKWATGATALSDRTSPPPVTVTLPAVNTDQIRTYNVVSATLRTRPLAARMKRVQRAAVPTRPPQHPAALGPAPE